MKAPRARTTAEAHLYMELRPCECGESGFDAHSAVVADGDALLSRYSGPCARCGAKRVFHFALPEEIPAIAGGVHSFGGAEPSRLIDAGEWLSVADEHAKRQPGTADDLAMAIAAMEEVLKFAPGDEEQLPGSAFWTERGRATRDAEPGRFRRDRLEAVLAAYRGLRTSTPADTSPPPRQASPLGPPSSPRESKQSLEGFPLPVLIELFSHAVAYQEGLAGDEATRYAANLAGRVQSLVKQLQRELAEARQRKRTSSELELLLDGISQTGTAAGKLVADNRAAISAAFQDAELARMADGMSLLSAWLRNPAGDKLITELLDQLSAAMSASTPRQGS